MALQNYKLALKLNESNVSALYGIFIFCSFSFINNFKGIIKCQILDDNFEEAEQQLEFLSEIQSATGKICHTICMRIIYLKLLSF